MNWAPLTKKSPSRPIIFIIPISSFLTVITCPATVFADQEKTAHGRFRMIMIAAEDNFRSPCFTSESVLAHFLGLAGPHATFFHTAQVIHQILLIGKYPSYKISIGGVHWPRGLSLPKGLRKRSRPPSKLKSSYTHPHASLRRNIVKAGEPPPGESNQLPESGRSWS